jgi:protein-S-isoprenylcysteine O-methyltransferase Ste14
MNRILPPVYFLAAVVLAILLHYLLPLYQLLALPWRLLGVLPLVIGIVLNLLADQAFKKHATTVKPLERSRVLVTAGVFAVSRNPMYLGMTLIVLGIAVLLGSAAPLLVAVALFVLLDRVFILAEERLLEDTFRDQFRQYRQRVRRWV